MKLHFTKMEGLGNDYIYFNCFKEQIDNPGELAVKQSDRHFGIGSDGIILIKPSKVADFKMEMYNADGSQSEMCGNGIRCVGKYVYDYGLTDKDKVSIETLAGIKYLQFDIAKRDDNDRGYVKCVTVNMGSPILAPKEIPTTIAGDKSMAVAETVYIAGNKYEVTCVSMGNPHCVAFVDDVDSFPLESVGAAFEGNTELFPRRVNAEFVEIVNPGYVKMRVYERGTGETLACGTGSCATVVACVLNGRTKDEVTVGLLGGELTVRFDREENIVYMTGPARIVFEGEVEI